MTVGVSVAGQLRGLCQAVLLGGGLGLAYDLLRVLRRGIPAGWVAIIADLLFWILATVGLFVFSREAWDGQIRLYGGLFCMMGGWAYFQGISPVILPLLLGILRLIRAILGILTAPVRRMERSFKRIGKFMKTSFLSEKKGV